MSGYVSDRLNEGLNFFGNDHLVTIEGNVENIAFFKTFCRIYAS